MALSIERHFGKAVNITMAVSSALKGRVDYARLYIFSNPSGLSFFDLPPVGAFSGVIPKHAIKPGGPTFIVCLPVLTDNLMIIRNYWGIPLFNLQPGKMCIICLANDSSIEGIWVIGCLDLAIPPGESSSSSAPPSTSGTPTPTVTVSSTTFGGTVTLPLGSFITTCSARTFKQGITFGASSGEKIVTLSGSKTVCTPSGPPSGISAW